MGFVPLATIDRSHLALFRDFIKAIPGQRRGPSSPNTAVSKTRYVQTLLDKAGPPGRGNRDAAGLIQSVPQIKRPRGVLREPLAVKPERDSATHRAADRATRPTNVGGKPLSLWWRALIVTVFNTGIRRGTVFSIELQNINWGLGVLRVPSESLKSRRDLTFPLNQTVIAHLRALWPEHEPRPPSARVFPRSRSGRVFDNSFAELRALAGIPESERFGLHDIRRSVRDRPLEVRFKRGLAHAWTYGVCRHDEPLRREVRDPFQRRRSATAACGLYRSPYSGDQQ